MMAVMRTSRLLMVLLPATYFWFPPDIRTIVVPSTYLLEMHASLPYLIGAVLCGSTTTGVSEVDPGHEMLWDMKGKSEAQNLPGACRVLVYAIPLDRHLIAPCEVPGRMTHEDYFKPKGKTSIKYGGLRAVVRTIMHVLY
ncbi:hypothetical protein B0H17DRAFT_1141064 [Mycena rosella]|uniref:Uncharacterized protein n=1 Tax=Mycena rosella TaxID=1033263 RepID=A0AAD7G6P4_MYCRO|nr:hypothetical protein B0H17DRAFT_1141064 [Mycena rosella]